MTRFRAVAGGLAVVGFGLLAGCRAGGQQGAPAEDPPVNLADSQVADVQVAVARTLESRGDHTQAMQQYAEAVKKDPKRADAFARLAVVADKQAMFAESADYHAKALALDPTNADYHCNLGYSLYLQHKWPDAARALQRAVELKPDHARAQNNLGLVYARAGQEEYAYQSFKRAGCSDADAQSNVAYGLTASGDFPAARKRYAAALAADPASQVAKDGLARLDAVAARLNSMPADREPVPPPGPAAIQEIRTAGGTGN